MTVAVLYKFDSWRDTAGQHDLISGRVFESTAGIIDRAATDLGLQWREACGQESGHNPRTQGAHDPLDDSSQSG